MEKVEIIREKEVRFLNNLAHREYGYVDEFSLNVSVCVWISVIRFLTLKPLSKFDWNLKFSNKIFFCAPPDLTRYMSNQWSTHADGVWNLNWIYKRQKQTRLKNSSNLVRISIGVSIFWKEVQRLALPLGSECTKILRIFATLQSIY